MKHKSVMDYIYFTKKKEKKDLVPIKKGTHKNYV